MKRQKEVKLSKADILFLHGGDGQSHTYDSFADVLADQYETALEAYNEHGGVTKEDWEEFQTDWDKVSLLVPLIVLIWCS